MCSDKVICFDNVSKVYQIYRKPSHRLLQLFLKERRLYDEFVALADIDLDVAKGETVGIIGKNGSGKSTLLQIAAGTLNQSTGEVWCEGRVAAILELGAGFNPEFTGIENVRLNASIMGMYKKEIEECMPRILEFSELGDFVDKPVKTYSSGMHVRLAFSVVINMKPDVLLVDEALAVGDMGFQRKCFRKLDELKNNGVTILLVTHGTDSVVTHCDRAVLLESGRIKQIGEPKLVVNHYLESLFDHLDGRALDETGQKGKVSSLSSNLNTDPDIDGCISRPAYNATEYRWGNKEAKIIDFVIFDKTGEELGSVCRSGSEVTISVSVYFSRAQKNLIYGLTIKTVDGITVFGSNSEKVGIEAKDAEAGEVRDIDFVVHLNLVSGEYFFSVGVVSMAPTSDPVILDRRYDLFRLLIEDDAMAYGYAALPFSINSVKQ